MKKNLSLFIILILLANCKNDNKINKVAEKNKKLEIINDTLNATTDEKKIRDFTIPKKPVFKNLQIDTTLLFGVWSKNKNNPVADFIISKKEIYYPDNENKSSFPYLISENEIEIFFNDFSQQGLIKKVTKDSLIIQWNDLDVESKYARYKNGYDYTESEIINTIDNYIKNYKAKKIDSNFINNKLNPKLKTLEKIIHNEFNEKLFDKLCELIIETNPGKRDLSTDLLAKIYTRYEKKVYEIINNKKKNQLLIEILEYPYIDNEIPEKSNQAFELKMPNVIKLKKELKDNHYIFDLLYLYLRDNYKITSKKHNIRKGKYNKNRICSFKQDFGKIKYFIDKCYEAGSTERIIIPKTDLEKVRELIEKLYAINDCDNCIKNKWKQNKMSFEPIDGGAGCYYKIKNNKNNIEIIIGCGC